jgi:hypothetical protein
MFTMILMLYLQQKLDVTLQSATPHGQYKSRAACEAAAVRLRGPVPIPHSYDAAWHDALCVPIQRNVRVNELKPADLARVLREQPASGCQAEGAWRRVADLCQGAPH